MKMKFKIFLQFSLYFLIQINSQTNAKAVLSIHISHYKNLNNLKHDGNKCETFHWAGDHCDPMFQICVTAKNPCDILKKKVEHWKNTKVLYNVLSQKIDLTKIERQLSVIVQVDDHDKFDAPDHIAVFSAQFKIETLNFFYKQKMQIRPRNLDISLQASIMIKCADSYYGANCDKKPTQCDKKCFNGNCSFDAINKEEICICFKGWSGNNCRKFISTDCSLLTCNKNCRSKEIRTCPCEADETAYYRKCIEKINGRGFTSEKPFTISSIISTTFKNTRTKIITTLFLARNAEVSVKSSTEKTSQSRNFSDIKKDYRMEKSIQNNHIVVSNLPFTVIVICLLVLLCVCLISLLLFIRKWQNRNQLNFPISSQFQRPLPPILFSRSPKTKQKFNYDSEGNPSIVKTNFYKETCTIPYTYSKREDNQYTGNKFENDIVDLYEEPIIDNMESLTCETDIYDSDQSDAYEIPNKH